MSDPDTYPFENLQDFKINSKLPFRAYDIKIPEREFIR